VVRKTEAGSSLKRWEKEKWQDTKSGKACGAGGSNEYCRPTKRVSSKTPTTKSEISPSKLAAKKAEKSRVGMGRRVSNI
jgi:phosphoribosylaminoimidazole-succinocarboxamide synthase